jgi:hypothetical protein
MAPEWLDRFCSYSVFKSLFFMGQCPMNLNIPMPKLRALKMGPKTQNVDFLENSCNSYN